MTFLGSLKKVLEKSRFHSKNMPGKNLKTVEKGKPSYMQVFSKNISNILKIKKNFPKLLNKKIKEINNIIFSKANKPRPRINVTVVVTTRLVFNNSTNNKSQSRISSREHKLCNSQENLTGNHNSILLTIYISIHGLCYDYASAIHPTLISMPCPHIYY